MRAFKTSFHYNVNHRPSVECQPPQWYAVCHSGGGGGREEERDHANWSFGHCLVIPIFESRTSVTKVLWNLVRWWVNVLIGRKCITVSRNWIRIREEVDFKFDVFYAKSISLIEFAVSSNNGWWDWCFICSKSTFHDWIFGYWSQGDNSQLLVIAGVSHNQHRFAVLLKSKILLDLFKNVAEFSPQAFFRRIPIWFLISPKTTLLKCLQLKC